MTEKLIWHNEKRKLGDLIPWDQNPRQIRKDEAERLAKSLELFGQVQTIAIDPDGEIVDGHQRKHVWSALEQFGANYEVDVRVASRKLTQRERQQLSVYLHEGAVGEWDFDGLANWEGIDVTELVEWGFNPYILGLDSEINYDEMWQGMPEFEQEDKSSYQSIHVHFRNAEDVKEFAELIGQRLTDKTRSIWYPQAEKIDMSPVYQDES